MAKFDGCTEEELAWLERALCDALSWVDCGLICPGASGLPRDGFYLTRFNCKLPFSELYPGDAATMKVVILVCLIAESLGGG